MCKSLVKSNINIGKIIFNNHGSSRESIHVITVTKGI